MAQQRDYDLIRQRIEASERKMREALKEIEANFCRSIQSDITHYQYLEEQAHKRGNEQEAAVHAFRRQVYEQILANYSLSRRYASV